MKQITSMLILFLIGGCQVHSPEKTVNAFYSQYLIVHKNGGLLWESELTKLSPFMSKKLVALIHNDPRSALDLRESPAFSGMDIPNGKGGGTMKHGPTRRIRCLAFRGQAKPQ
jgi:hypothetical protein